MAHSVPMMQPGCPWSALSNAWPPNVKWCEAQVCGWVVEPANTWSNLAYIAIGLGLLVYAHRHQDSLLRGFGWAEVVVGVTSFVYHMAWNSIFQLFDFLGMYLFVSLLLLLNLIRLGRLDRKRLGVTLTLSVAGLTAVTPLWGWLGAPIQLIVLSMIVAILATEFAMRRESIDRRFFWLSLLLLGVAFAFSVSDVTRLRCNPEDHLLQGHAIWHVLGALSLLASARFYRQFGLLQSA